MFGFEEYFEWIREGCPINEEVKVINLGCVIGENEE
jgi:hypothetical protein